MRGKPVSLPLWHLAPKAKQPRETMARRQWQHVSVRNKENDKNANVGLLLVVSCDKNRKRVKKQQKNYRLCINENGNT
jgi:hypothetical protein